MIVREATAKDISSLIDFQLKMALETENLTLDIHTLTMGIQRLFKDPLKGKYYVAEEGNDIAGCLMTTYEWSDWRCGTVWWIQSVYVSETFRGKGVYRAMYEHIKNIVMADPELRGIRLYVDKSNKNAKATYEKLGMNGEHYEMFEWMK